MIHRYKPDAEDARRRARRIYGVAWIGAALLLFGLPFLVLPPGLLMLWCLVFSSFLFWPIEWIATGACRLAGVSQEDETSEVIRRDERAALAPLLSEAPVLALKHRGKPWTSVNREGIFFKGWKGEPRGISWLEVETCTFSTKYDALGNRASSCLLLHSRGGRTLVQMAPTEEQASDLLPAIRFYLRGQGIEGIREEPTST